MMIDNVNLIIYPVEYAKKNYADHWKGKTEIESTRGHVVDHIAFSFDNLADALERLRKDGVKVTDEIRRLPTRARSNPPSSRGRIKSASN